MTARSLSGATHSRATGGAASPLAHASSDDGDPREAVEDTIEEHPWLLRLARTGWLAKGVVYLLMGLTAIDIGRHRPTGDDASPEGVLAQVAGAPLGRTLLVVLILGLAVYVLWRTCSAGLVRGNGARDWLTRIGYLASAAFYTVLATSAFGAVVRGEEPGRSDSVESLSSRMLGTTGGRWILMVVGLIIVIVGLVFIVDKGVRRSFRDDMHLEQASEGERRLVEIAGVVGWTGRGLVTAAVGGFVMNAARTADRSEARGFDRALRELASRQVGGTVVICAGVALIAYALYCWVSLRHRRLEG
jgi:hypothetical protein